MKFKLTDYLLFAFIIICLVFLWGSDFFLKYINYEMEIVLIVLFLIIMLVNLFLDIKDKRYSTKILIIAADVVEIIAILTLCYFGLGHIDSTNVELLLKRMYATKLLGIVLLLMITLKSKLKSERFEKNVDGINDLL